MANFALRTVVWIGSVTVWLLLRRPAGMDWTDVVWRPASVLGAGVAILGIACYVWSATALAGAVPDTVDAPARLLARGPFAHVRNPLYLSAGAVFVGVTTVYGLWQRLDAIALPVIGLMVHLFVVYREEPKTRERLGPGYDTYRSTVPRWIPRV